MNEETLLKQANKTKQQLDLFQSVIVYTILFFLASIITKLIILKSFHFLNNILEISLLLSGLIILISDLILRKKQIKLKPKTLKIIAGVFLATLSVLYVFSKVFIFKNNLVNEDYSLLQYLNIMVALYLSGVIILLLIYKPNNYSLLKGSIAIFSFFLFLILLTLFFDAVLAGPAVKENIINAFLFAFFITIIHYLVYLLYTYLKAKDEALLKENKTSIVSKTLILFVALYSIFALIKDLNHILYVHFHGPSLPQFILKIESAELVFFIYSTFFITLVIFSLKSSLNRNNPRSKTLVNSAVILWLVKILNNVLVRINNHLFTNGTLTSDAHSLIGKILTPISLIFNISLLLLGLLIIFKNKFPNLKLWLGLAIVQIINFVFNMIFSLVSKDPATFLTQEVTRLSVNFILTSGKLVFVFLIIIQYQKPLVLDKEEKALITEE